MRIPKCQASTRNGLISRMPTRTKRDVQTVEIQSLRKAFSTMQRSSNVKFVTSLDTLPAFVIRRSKLYSSQEKPKAHQLQVGAVYTIEGTICSQSEDYSSSNDSFCFQIKVQHTQANLQKIPKPDQLITNLVLD